MLSISMGMKNNPVVPPALIADIGAGSYPALLNILFALSIKYKKIKLKQVPAQRGPPEGGAPWVEGGGPIQ